MEGYSRDSNQKCKYWFITLAISTLMLALFTYGIVLCVEASEDVHSDEVDLINSSIKSWEDSYQAFTNLTVWIQPLNNPSLYLHSSSVPDWSLKDEDILPYIHYKYYANSSLLLANFSGSTTKIQNPEVTHIQHFEYNITTNFSLYIETPKGNITENEVSPVVLFQKKHKGYNMKCTISIDSM